MAAKTNLKIGLRQPAVSHWGKCSTPGGRFTKAHVQFTEWTSDALVRHANFAGLRDDKHARELTREGGEKAEARRSSDS